MKKVISLFLCVVMVFGIAAMSVSAQSFTGKDVPIVYVQGQGANLVDASGKLIYPINVPDGYIGEAFSDCIPYFMDAVTSDDWSAYKEKLAEWLYPVFEEIQLNNDGETGGLTRREWSWTPASIKNSKSAAGYGIYTYNFTQDWRLDPVDTAKELKQYVDRVKEVTGSDKVNIVGRCMGANVVLAYMAEYGYDDFNCIELYVPSITGIETVSALFSDNMYMDANALNGFIKDGKISINDLEMAIDDPVIVDLITAALKFTTETYLLDAGTLYLDVVFFHKLYKEVLADMILHSYGTFPGIWSLVRPNEFEDAVQGIFAGKEEEYAGLIEKIRYYDTNVRQRSEEILKEATESGIKIAVYAKYGDYPNIPISYYSSNVTDGVACLGNTADSILAIPNGGSSLGATTAKLGTVLTGKYVKDTKYLSPDKKVNASTCLFPDTTWFTANNAHKNFPASIDTMMLEFFRTNGEMTVFSDARYPQYTKLDANNNLLIMTSDDYVAPQKDEPLTKQGFLDMLKSLLKAIITFVKQLFANKEAA